MALTESQLRSAKPRNSRYRLTDGGGLVMDVTPAGKKVWRFRYQRAGKDAVVTLGTYPVMTLLEARQAALDLKRSGTDPKAAAARQKATDDVTFQSVTEAYMAREKPHWVEAHYKRFHNRMTRDVWPVIGAMHPRDIQPVDAMNAVAGIEARGAQDTAVRTLGMVGQVLRYAVARGQADRDVTADLKGGLDRPPPVQHMNAVTDRSQVGQLLAAVWDWPFDGYGKAVNQLAAYLFQRPGELVAMRWSDVDLDKALWTYRVTKVGIDHAVPLPDQAVEILTRLHALTGRYDYVFYSINSRSDHVSLTTPVNLLKKLGWRGKHTVHGWRATARTLIAEDLKVDPMLIERQLSHVTGSVHGRAYNRTMYLDERRDMMQRYANLLDEYRRSV